MGEEGLKCCEEFPDRASMIKIREGIQRRGVAVDDGEHGPALLGDHRKGGGWLHLERGADNDEDFRRLAQLLGASHRDNRHRLSERDRGGLEKSAATIAERWGGISGNLLVDRLRVELLFATKADHFSIRAVKLDHLFLGDPGQTMKPVHVLRDEP